MSSTAAATANPTIITSSIRHRHRHPHNHNQLVSFPNSLFPSHSFPMTVSITTTTTITWKPVRCQGDDTPSVPLVATASPGYGCDYYDDEYEQHCLVVIQKPQGAKPTFENVTKWSVEILRRIKSFKRMTNDYLIHKVYGVWLTGHPSFGISIYRVWFCGHPTFGVVMEKSEVRELQLLLKSKAKNSSEEEVQALHVIPDSYVKDYRGMMIPGGMSFRRFSFEDLIGATKNFDKSSLLGESSYGKLYGGKLPYNLTQVAIRCLPLSKKYTIPNVKLMLDLFAKLRHPHLVTVIGYRIDDSSQSKVYLVNEYVPNWTFRDYLSGNSLGKVLNWSERLAILIGVAEAVHFLHNGISPGFFCNRLKTNNILVDEHGMAKLSDFGLSILAEETDKSKAKDGLTSRQMKSLEDDAYSFGYILLEALVGSSMLARSEAFLQNNMASINSQDDWKHIVEPVVLATCSQESLSIVISIINKCICPDSSRPSFEDILWNLQYAVQVQATAYNHQRFDASHF